jgi:regulatory protein
MTEEEKQRALQYVARRMRTEQEVRLYLESKGSEPDDIDEVVRYLYSYGYLNDEAFVRAYVNDRVLFHPCGRYLMEAKLKEKGVRRSVREKVLDEVFPMEREAELLQKEYEKYRAHGKSHQQALRHFYQKGFSSSLLYDLEDQDEEEEPDWDD